MHTNFPVTSPLRVSDCFSSSAENFFVLCILSGFIIYTAGRFAIAVFALTLEQRPNFHTVNHGGATAAPPVSPERIAILYAVFTIGRGAQSYFF